MDLPPHLKEMPERENYGSDYVSFKMKRMEPTKIIVLVLTLTLVLTLINTYGIYFSDNASPTGNVVNNDAQVSEAP